MRPLIIIAIVVTVTAFYFANNILPHTNLQFTTLLYSVKEQRPELVLQPGVFTNEMDGYSIKVGDKDKKTNMLYNVMIYDHTKNKTNMSVTVADSGFLRITKDKKYMVLNLYHGVNYSEVAPKNRRERRTHPYQRNRFKEETIRVKVRDFGFNRRDESIFKNSYRMLNIKQLNFMEDTLGGDYHKRLRSYIMKINLNTPITRKIYNLTVPNDSLKRDIKVVTPDTIINFAGYFNGLDKFVKAEIANTALADARNNMQNINMYQGSLYQSKKNLNKYEMEHHRKFTLSVAVLVFFFIGAPLGAIIRKGGLGMPVVVSILLFIAYYIVSMTGEKSAREDVWNMFSGMWFSTFIFLPVGVWLTYKAATDSAIMNAETYTKIIHKLGLGKFFRKEKKKK